MLFYTRLIVKNFDSCLVVELKRASTWEYWPVANELVNNRLIIWGIPSFEELGHYSKPFPTHPLQSYSRGRCPFTNFSHDWLLSSWLLFSLSVFEKNIFVIMTASSHNWAEVEEMIWIETSSLIIKLKAERYWADSEIWITMAKKWSRYQKHARSLTLAWCCAEPLRRHVLIFEKLA